MNDVMVKEGAFRFLLEFSRWWWVVVVGFMTVVRS